MRLQEYLTEKEERKVVVYNIKNVDQLHQRMKEMSVGNEYAWIAHTVFGMTTLTAYKRPSLIPYIAIGDSPIAFKGFYQNGEFKDFPTAQKIKYQNSNMGSE
jgi:hypothetical protein